jgi:hypothetical protein
MKNEGWTTSKAGQVLKPMLHCGAIHQGGHRCGREAPRSGRNESMSVG